MDKEKIRNILYDIISNNIEDNSKISDLKDNSSLNIKENLEINKFQYCSIIIDINDKFNIDIDDFIIDFINMRFIDRSVNELVEFINKQINKE